MLHESPVSSGAFERFPFSSCKQKDPENFLPPFWERKRLPIPSVLDEIHPYIVGSNNNTQLYAEYKTILEQTPKGSKQRNEITMAAYT